MNSFIKAFSIFTGTIIGVGIFALPYIAMQAGFFILTAYFLILGYVVFIVHSMFAKVALGTDGFLRLPGYVHHYLGNRIYKFYSATIPFNFSSVLVLYIIIGGSFLYSLLHPYFGGDMFIYSVIFFMLGSVFVFLGRGSISFAELLFIVFLVIVVLIFLAAGIKFFDLSNLFTKSLENLPLPYGAVLFSLWGLAIVPELEDTLSKNSFKILNVIKYGIIFSIIYYLFFTFVVLGISGPLTTQDSLTGLSNIIGDGVSKVGYILGFFTCFTSFLTLGLTFKKTLWYDFKINRLLSFLIAVLLPFIFFIILYLFYIINFVNIVSVVGALFLGIDSFFVIWIYKKYLKIKENREFPASMYVLPIMFIAGIFITFIYFFIS